MRRLGLLITGSLAALANVQCGSSEAQADDHEHGHDDHGHGHDDHGHGDHGHGGHGHDDHGHGHGASETVTLWGESTQLFVEFPALVQDEQSAFAAHLTRLSDHLAVDSGTVTVELSGGGHDPEVFTISEPSQAGIFRPVVEPAHVAERQVTLRLESSIATETHELGTFEVFTNRRTADAAAGHESEDPHEISFLLEQQWPIEFGIAEVITAPLRPNVPAFAHLTLPNGAVAIATAPRGGRIVGIDGRLPQVGDRVEVGDVLFSLSLLPEDAADSAGMDLAVDQANIRVRATQREVDRLQPLVSQGVVAQRRLDEAESDLASAQAALRSARRRRTSVGQSQNVEGTSDSLAIPSPLSGVVAQVHATAGAWVSEGDEVVRIVHPDTLWVDVDVPEAYLGLIQRVSGVWLDATGFDEPIDIDGASLVSVGVELELLTRTLPVRFEIDNSDGRLYAGMSAQAHLVTDEVTPVPAIPMHAVVDDSGIDVVYVQTGGETFERRPVRLGIRDGALVHAEGVEPGEWIATEGAYAVKLASRSTESVGHGHAH